MHVIWPAQFSQNKIVQSNHVWYSEKILLEFHNLLQFIFLRYGYLDQTRYKQQAQVSKISKIGHKISIISFTAQNPIALRVQGSKWDHLWQSVGNMNMGHLYIPCKVCLHIKPGVWERVILLYRNCVQFYSIVFSTCSKHFVKLVSMLSFAVLSLF